MYWKLVSAGAVGLMVTASAVGTDTKDSTESWVRPPKETPAPTDHVFGPDQMVRFYDPPGEYGYALEGKDYGFEALSIIISDTQPGGGPPLHSHDIEEAHVLQEGTYRALIGKRRVEVTGPAVVRVPAGVPHTFVNTSSHIIHVIGILPGDTISYTELGSNPLLKELEGGAKERASKPGDP